MATIPKQGVVNLGNDSLGAGEPIGLAAGGWLGPDSALCKVMVATVGLNAGDAVLSDFANGVNNVTKTGAADSTLRYGIALNTVLAGQQVVVAVLGFALGVASAAIAVNAILANSATAGQLKTAAAAG